MLKRPEDIQQHIIEVLLPEITEQLFKFGECYIIKEKFTISDICEDAALWDEHNHVVLAVMRDSITDVEKTREILLRKIEARITLILSTKEAVDYYFNGGE